MKNNYINTVSTERECLKHMLSTQIIPRCYSYLKLVKSDISSEIIRKRSNKFITAFEFLLEKEEQLVEWKDEKSLKALSELRHFIY